MFELKKVKYMASLSQETHCYSADLYLHGRKVAEVSNHGHGGCDDVGYVNKLMAQYVSEELAKMDAPLEAICCDLVNDWLAAKDLKKLLSKRVIYTRDDMPGLYQTQTAKNAATRDAWASQVAKDPHTSQVLNNESFDTALRIFKECTQ